MSISPGKGPRRPRRVKKNSRAIGLGIVAMRRAARIGWGSVVRIDGQRLAIIPLDFHPRLERALEREDEAKEALLDRLDVEEAERRLADPNDLTIPFEQALREIESGDLPG